MNYKTMSDEIRVNRPQAPVQSPAMMPQTEVQSSNSKMPWIILGVVVVVIVVLGILFRDKLFGGSGGKMNGQQQTQNSKPSGYQAVFLTNGQVYFGKVSNPDGNYVTMNDIFYLQVVQQPPLQGQQDPNAAADPNQQQQGQPQISLVKLGNELHGPVDEMQINRDHILFYEDLKNDGQVVQAINNYKTNPSGTAPQQ